MFVHSSFVVHELVQHVHTDVCRVGNHSRCSGRGLKSSTWHILHPCPFYERRMMMVYTITTLVSHMDPPTSLCSGKYFHLKFRFKNQNYLCSDQVRSFVSMMWVVDVCFSLSEMSLGLFLIWSPQLTWCITMWGSNLNLRKTVWSFCVAGGSALAPGRSYWGGSSQKQSSAPYWTVLEQSSSDVWSPTALTLRVRWVHVCTLSHTGGLYCHI